MKKLFNPLLARQLRRLGFDVENLVEQDSLARLLAVISQTYDDADQDRYTLERSLSISSKEMHELYRHQSTAYEVRLRTLFKSIHDLVWLKDPEGVYLACNPAFERFFGAKEASIIGKTDYDFVSKELADFFIEHDRIALSKSEKSVNEEWLTFADDGYHGLFETVKTAMSDESGQLFGVLGVARDITERKSTENLLRRHKRMIETMNDGFWVTDTQGFLHEANQAYADMMGYSIESLLGMHIRQLDANEDLNFVQERIDQVIAHGHLAFETQHRHKDGQLIAVEISATYISETAELFVFCRDICKRKRTEEALLKSQQRWKFALEESAGDGVWEYDFVLGTNLISKRLMAILGFDTTLSQEQNPLNDWMERLAPESFQSTINALQDVLDNKTDSYVLEQYVRCEDGGYKWLHTRGKVLKRAEDGKPMLMIGTSGDITEHKRMLKEIRQLGFFDQLTKLPNRRMLNDRLSQALALSKRTGRYGALMFIDLDNFKPLNDQFGHNIGDLLLIEVAARLTRDMREMDTVARFGGDEFVIVLSELEAEEASSTLRAHVAAKKIQASIGQPYHINVTDKHGSRVIEHSCSASIGVAMFINHNSPQEDVVKWADMAMYDAKAAGRNQIYFYNQKLGKPVECEISSNDNRLEN